MDVVGRATQDAKADDYMDVVGRATQDAKAGDYMDVVGRATQDAKTDAPLGAFFLPLEKSAYAHIKDRSFVKYIEELAHP